MGSCRNFAEVRRAAIAYGAASGQGFAGGGGGCFVVNFATIGLGNE